MKITARLENSVDAHVLSVATNGAQRTLGVLPKPTGRGSSVSGGELLLAALATCVCNDLFREAAKRGLTVDDVAVEAEADFPAEGAPAESVRYRVRISGPGDAAALRELVRHTDAVAEIQNTVRSAIPVKLEHVEVSGG
ncbi:MAG TPA: OsmC family protein [Longimicrobiales bacterium]|nr:OsmC family protein [Longimicrobiales bacterium]